MAGWLIIGLRASERMMPLTRSAKVKYLRPAAIHAPLRLFSEVISTEKIDKSKAQESIVIHTEIRNEDDKLLTVVDFDYVAVPEAVFRTMVGIEELPESFQQHFAAATPEG